MRRNSDAAFRNRAAALSHSVIFTFTSLLSDSSFGTVELLDIVEQHVHNQLAKMLSALGRRPDIAPASVPEVGVFFVC